MGSNIFGTDQRDITQFYKEEIVCSKLIF